MFKMYVFTHDDVNSCFHREAFYMMIHCIQHKCTELESCQTGYEHLLYIPTEGQHLLLNSVTNFPTDRIH